MSMKAKSHSRSMAKAENFNYMFVQIAVPEHMVNDVLEYIDDCLKEERCSTTESEGKSDSEEWTEDKIPEDSDSSYEPPSDDDETE